MTDTTTEMNIPTTFNVELEVSASVKTLQLLEEAGVDLETIVGAMLEEGIQEMDVEDWSEWPGVPSHTVTLELGELRE